MNKLSSTQKIRVFISSKCDKAGEPPKYNPIRSELKNLIESTTLPDPEFAEQMHDNNPNPEDVAISNVAVEEYWKTLDPNDRIIIKMLMAGFTQKQAAIEVGIANNSGVSKRISKIRKDITKKTGIKI